VGEGVVGREGGSLFSLGQGMVKVQVRISAATFGERFIGGVGGRVAEVLLAVGTSIVKTLIVKTFVVKTVVDDEVLFVKGCRVRYLLLRCVRADGGGDLRDRERGTVDRSLDRLVNRTSVLLLIFSSVSNNDCSTLIVVVVVLHTHILLFRYSASLLAISCGDSGSSSLFHSVLSNELLLQSFLVLDRLAMEFASVCGSVLTPSQIGRLNIINIVEKTFVEVDGLAGVVSVKSC
jgi:hypothetical protein